MSSYISSDDYTDYGLSSATTANQVATASNLINAYLGRPEGLIWTADANGQPCYMQDAVAAMTYTASAAIAAGDDVVVTLPYSAPQALIGQPVVIDKDSDTLREVVSVTQASGKTITLDSVAFDHASGVDLSTGLIIRERKSFGYARAMAFLKRRPIVRVVSVSVRTDPRDRRGARLTDANRRYRTPYAIDGYGAISEVLGVEEPNYLNFISDSGYRYDPETGEMALYASSRSIETRVSYIAGWTEDTLPEVIPQATALMVSSLQSAADLPGNATSYTAGGTQVVRTVTRSLTSDIIYELNAYRVIGGL